MKFISKYVWVIVAFIVGWAIGLFLFGWYLTPVQWDTSSYVATPNDLAPEQKAVIINTTALAFAQSGQNPQIVTNAFSGWSNPAGEICAVASETSDQQLTTVYNEMVRIVNNGQDCSAVPAAGDEAPAATADEGGANTTVVLGLLLILIVLAIAIILVFRKRQNVMDADGDDDDGPGTYYDMPESTPVSDDEGAATPLARFPSNYTYGRDNFDDSHSIENSNGDFLGECGVGISESIGSDTPKSVTAFEVWLFDKNDIRTVTKVIMSDHAFFDDALKAKLAPKGEPVLAREGEVIVLETATLIINAEIREMAYGENGDLPPQSYFDNFTIELSAWAKDADMGDSADAAAATTAATVDNMPAPAIDNINSEADTGATLVSDDADENDVDDLLDY